MLWTEKYRPNKWSDVIGQTDFVLDAEHWVENRNMPNVLLFGPPGVGKTAAAISLASDLLGDDLENNYFEINASDDRKLETVRSSIKEIASTSKIGEAPFKIILLDEMDGMTKDAQNALKRIMERYADNCRFIITCNARHRIIGPLLSRCANYQFNHLDNENMISVLENVLQAEGVKTFSKDDLEMFIEYLHGDLRRGLTELQACHASNSNLRNQIDKNLQPYTEILQLINQNEYDNSLKKVHDLIYSSVGMDTICVNLHDTVLKTDMPQQKKFKFLKFIGECEWRSSRMTPKLLASWMIGQMI